MFRLVYKYIEGESDCRVQCVATNRFTKRNKVTKGHGSIFHTFHKSRLTPPNGQTAGPAPPNLPRHGRGYPDLHTSPKGGRKHELRSCRACNCWWQPSMIAFTQGVISPCHPRFFNLPISPQIIGIS
ncbi:uncharacterized protein LOC135202253 isoform X2 [Macrobrachium nipponense]|uniref:uncharacterized protein LOC135202253 isoform X2 n=1 Tax=Macrobrachium nipponense TaxID=159736 RepID=UPI0030C7B2D1